MYLPPPVSKPRLDYVDAMRGLAMFMVVAGHTLLFSFSHGGNLFLGLHDQLQIPLFFMVSGYLMLRTPERWRQTNIFKFLGEKFLLLVIPATIFMLLYDYVADINIVTAIKDTWKSGYWFTFSLFEFIFVYICANQAFRLVTKKVGVQLLCHSLLAIILLYAGMYAIRQQNNYTAIDILGLTHFTTYPYFIMGMVVRKYLSHKDFTQTTTKLPIIVMACVIVLFFLGDFYTYYPCMGLRYIGPSSAFYFMTLTIFGLIIIYFAFRRYPILSDDSHIGKFLKLLGRRSLDVYFIHYFFLPRHLSVIGEWFIANSNPFIEYCLALAIAVLLSYASIAVGAILRMNKITALLLLGVKSK